MPVINQTNQIDITPEKFLDACSDSELMEVDILIQSNRFVQRLNVLVESEQYFKSQENEKGYTISARLPIELVCNNLLREIILEVCDGFIKVPDEKLLEVCNKLQSRLIYLLQHDLIRFK